jgi:hypothetical protein
MAEQPTCGRGLAENSPLPAKLGELTASLAENLEVHLRALDLDDEHARRERGAYEQLAARYRDVAARLEATSRAMAGYRDLPMARHDQEAMSSPEVAEAFERFVDLKQELLALLQGEVERDRRMLAEMG